MTDSLEFAFEMLNFWDSLVFLLLAFYNTEKNFIFGIIFIFISAFFFMNGCLAIYERFIKKK